MLLFRKVSSLRPTTALVPLAAAAGAVVLSRGVPLLGPLLIALIAGAAIANTRWAEAPLITQHATATKFLLRLGIVLIGLRISMGQIASIGVRGLLVIVATVALTFWLTRALGRRLGLDEPLVVLIAAGFSICGAAAIAAIDEAVQARKEDVALAVALVTVYGSVMIAGLPMLAGWLALPDAQAAIWAGASIHEVAQVVASASLIGSGAVAVALTIKLGRVALLAPVFVLAVRQNGPREASTPTIPWFLTGFAIAVAVRSTGFLPSSVLDVASVATTIALAAGMFGLGLGLRVRHLWPVPTRAFWLAAASTAVAASTSLMLILVLY